MCKKIVIILMALLLAFSFSSCKKGPMTEAEFIAYLVDYVEFDYEAYEKEKERIIGDDSTQGFLPYEKIGLIGEYYSFHYFHGSTRETGEYITDVFGKTLPYTIFIYNHIVYVCRDEADQYVEVHIFYTEQHAMPSTEIAYEGMTRLDASAIDPNSRMKQLLPGYNGGFVDIGNVRYIYTHGKLQGIKWVYGGYEFMLDRIYGYPAEVANTFVARMLDPALASAALADFVTCFENGG